MLLPFATLAFGHVLAALTIFAAFLLVRSRGMGSAAAAGAVIGLGVLVEYPVALAALGLLVYLAITGRRRVLPFLAGGLPFAVTLALYHGAAFGHPLHTSYRYANAIRADFEGIGVTWPDLSDLVAVIIGERGLLLLTPLVILGLVGLAYGQVSVPTLRRRESWLCLALFVAFVLLPTVWLDEAAGPTGGFAPGPRFVVPALPLLVGGVASTYVRLPRTTTLIGLLSIFVMGLATVTDPLAPIGTATPAITYWIELALEGDFRPNILVSLLGPVGLALHTASIVGLAWLLHRVSRDARSRSALA